MAAACCVAAGCATTGEVRGRLVLPPAPPGRASDAVVYVVSDDPGSRPASTGPTAPARRERTAAGRRQVALTRKGFEPRVLALAAGTTVLFKNRDHVYHKLFSVSPACRFNLKGFAPGQSEAVLFDTAGVVNVYCELDPAAAAYVFVLPDRLFARPRADGRFTLPRLPPGAYVVKVWHPALGETSRRVKVPRGRGVDLRLEL
jgi:plastocyanin